MIIELLIAVIIIEAIVMITAFADLAKSRRELDSLRRRKQDT